MADIPRPVRDAVRASLGRQFDALRWEALTNPERTEAYERFVRDPTVGGLLAPYKAAGDIRVWIKDGPAKEYGRALEGRGYMAEHVSRAYPGPGAVVRSALGDEWKARIDAMNEKPMRCFAEDGKGQSMFVIWGPLTALQGLIWHSALIRADEPTVPITIAITKPGNGPVSAGEWELVERLADIVDADCRQVTYTVGKKPAQINS